MASRRPGKVASNPSGVSGGPSASTRRLRDPSRPGCLRSPLSPFPLFFCLDDTATAVLYSPSLHDALPFPRLA